MARATPVTSPSHPLFNVIDKVFNDYQIIYMDCGNAIYHIAKCTRIPGVVTEV